MADGKILRQASACQDELLISQILNKTKPEDIIECCSALDAEAAARLVDQLVYKFLDGDNMDVALQWLKALLLVMDETAKTLAAEPLKALQKYIEARQVIFQTCVDTRAKLERLEIAVLRSVEINALTAAL